MIRSTLIQLGCAVALLVGIGAAYWWGYTEVMRVKQDSYTLATHIQTENQARTQSAKTRDKVGLIEAQKAMVESHIVRPEDIVSFLSYMEHAGKPFHALVEVVSVGDVNADGKIPVSLTITGTFDAVMRTLGSLENGPYVLAMQNVTLQVQEVGQWNLSGAFFVVSTIKKP